METHILEVRGMTCASCPRIIEQVLSRIDGVIEVNANLVAENVTIIFNSTKISLQRIIQSVDDMGWSS